MDDYEKWANMMLVDSDKQIDMVVKVLTKEAWNAAIKKAIKICEDTSKEYIHRTNGEKNESKSQGHDFEPSSDDYRAVGASQCASKINTLMADL